MASENEIQILIRAVDDTTKTLDNIEKKVNSSAKNIEKSNKSLSGSFSSVQGAMLNLGQAAQQIHNIFEIGQARTRNLENAQDRLENANIRLKQATQNLTDSQRKLNDMQDAGARDSITLERAQLRLLETEKRVNQLQNEGLSPSNTILREAMLDLKEAQLDVSDAQKLGAKRAQELSDAQQEVKDSQDSVVVATNGVDRATRQLNKTIGNAKWAYVDMGMQALSATGSLGTFAATIGTKIPAIGGMFTGLGTTIMGALALIPGWGWAILAVIGIVAGLITVFGKWGDIWNWIVGIWTNNVMPILETLNTWLQFILLPVWVAWKLAIFALGEAFNWLTTNVFKPFYDFLSTYIWPIIEKVINGISKVSEGIGSVMKKATGIVGGVTNAVKSVVTKATTKKNDFLMRPGQPAVPFSSDDTIIGMKNTSGLGGGMVINITGDNYGTDPKEIADAIMGRLRRKINI